MAQVISDWALVAEPQILPQFSHPSYATDIVIVNDGFGIVMTTPDATSLYRIFIDFDGAVNSEFFAVFDPNFNPGTIIPNPNLRPVFGSVQKDILLLAPGSGILMPAGFPVSGPVPYFRMRLDNDGTPGVEPVTLAQWILIPEFNQPEMLSVNGDWVFDTDIVFAVSGQGIVMPMRGTGQTRRIRLDSDGAIGTE